ncbi:hypothetical protein ABTC24_19250, partial [Acinetobacter baumannii]
VLNRVGSSNEIPIEKAAETIGKPVKHQIPDDPKPIAGARNEGKPLVQFAPKSKAQAAYNALASALAGKPLTSVAKEAARGWSFFSRR